MSKIKENNYYPITTLKDQLEGEFKISISTYLEHLEDDFERDSIIKVIATEEEITSSSKERATKFDRFAKDNYLYAPSMIEILARRIQSNGTPYKEALMSATALYYDHNNKDIDKEMGSLLYKVDSKHIANTQSNYKMAIPIMKRKLQKTLESIKSLTEEKITSDTSLESIEQYQLTVNNKGEVLGKDIITLEYKILDESNLFITTLSEATLTESYMANTTLNRNNTLDKLEEYNKPYLPTKVNKKRI